MAKEPHHTCWFLGYLCHSPEPFCINVSSRWEVLMLRGSGWEIMLLGKVGDPELASGPSAQLVLAWRCSQTFLQTPGDAPGWRWMPGVVITGHPACSPLRPVRLRSPFSSCSGTKPMTSRILQQAPDLAMSVSSNMNTHGAPDRAQTGLWGMFVQ